ncbi:MAG: hypothetical protein ACKOWX_06880 [Flavobacteriales bacterium]
MHFKKLLFILAVLSHCRCWTQVSLPSCLFSTLSSNCASNCNLQYSNPAAYTSKDVRGQFVYLDFAPRISNMGAMGYSRYYPKAQSAFYHELSILFQAACPQIQTTQALGLRATTRLQLGIGFQLKWLVQPAFYGSRTLLSARFGAQYTLSSQQQFALTLADIGNAQGQQFSLAYKQEFNSGSALTFGLNWKLPFLPSWFLGVSKPLKNGQVDFTYRLFPQQFQLTLQFQKIKNKQFLISQGWNKGLGTYLQLGIKF